jgi:ADP-ribose pyrophosphatase YjhB (NUDIX family)
LAPVPALPVRFVRLAYLIGYPLARATWLVARRRGRGVKVVVLHGHRVLLVRHTYGDRRSWQLPGGFLHRGEAPELGARREVAEEVGVDIVGWRALGEMDIEVRSRQDHVWLYAAEVDGDAIDPQLTEIAEARWFPRDALPARMATQVAEIVGRA